MAARDNESGKRVFAHIWSLPAEFFEAATLPNAAQTHKTAESPTLVVGSAASAASGASGDVTRRDAGHEATADARAGRTDAWREQGFASIDEARAYYKSDLYRLNQRRKASGRAPLTAEEFDKIVEEGGDVSSISGSDESSEDEEEEEAEGIPEEEEEEAHAAGAGAGRRRRRRGGGGGAGGAAGHELQAKAVFRSGDGSLFALWRSALISPSEEKADSAWGRADSDGALSRLKKLRASGGKWAVILARGGHFAAAIVSQGGTEILAHRTFHRYVIRAKQGGRQSSKDATGKSIKSAGSALRRANEQALEKDIRELLGREWAPLLAACEAVFVAASDADKRTIYQGDAAPLRRDDPRIRGVPFATRRPTFSETKRVLTQLASVEMAVDPQLYAAVAAAEAAARERDGGAAGGDAAGDGGGHGAGVSGGGGGRRKPDFGDNPEFSRAAQAALLKDYERAAAGGGAGTSTEGVSESDSAVDAAVAAAEAAERAARERERDSAAVAAALAAARAPAGGRGRAAALLASKKAAEEAAQAAARAEREARVAAAERRMQQLAAASASGGGARPSGPGGGGAGAAPAPPSAANAAAALATAAAFSVGSTIGGGASAATAAAPPAPAAAHPQPVSAEAAARIEQMGRTLAESVQPDAAVTLSKVLANAAGAPSEEKFRRLRLGNPKVAEAVVASGALDGLLREVGFVRVHQGEPPEAFAVQTEADARRWGPAMQRCAAALYTAAQSRQLQQQQQPAAPAAAAANGAPPPPEDKAAFQAAVQEEFKKRVAAGVAPNVAAAEAVSAVTARQQQQGGGAEEAAARIH